MKKLKAAANRLRFRILMVVLLIGSPLWITWGIIAAGFQEVRGDIPELYRDMYRAFKKGGLV